MKKTFAYCRISSTSQSLERQIELVKEYGVEDRDIFKDVKSGKNMDREQYQLLKRIIRPGDCLVICEMDRIGRNMTEIKEELQWFKNNQIEMKILDLPILNSSGLEGQLIQNILIELYSYLAEKERQKILYRQKQGIKIAKEQGKYKGRKPKELDEEIVKLIQSGEISVLEGCRRMGIDSSTYYRKMKKRQV